MMVCEYPICCQGKPDGSQAIVAHIAELFVAVTLSLGLAKIQKSKSVSKPAPPIRKQPLDFTPTRWTFPRER
jgi:hypothetical protein